MSQNIESPMSDNKMDISDTTNSQESAGVSPIAENDILIDNESPRLPVSLPLSPSMKSPMVYRTISTKSTTLQTNESFDNFKLFSRSAIHDLHQNQRISADDNESNIICDDKDNVHDPIVTQKKVSKSQLDNGYMDDSTSFVLHQGQQYLPKNISNLTLANIHPLMSPAATDSDSENSYNQQVTNNQRNVQTFPDIVPPLDHKQQDALNVLQKTRLVSGQLNNKKSMTLVTTKNSINSNSTRLSIKPSILRAPSPDIISSESEPELSQYHTSVEVNFQSVALVPNLSASNNGRRKMLPTGRISGGSATGVSDLAVSDDISSLDSISNHSFDDDGIEHNLASLSPSSSLMEGLDGDDEDDAVDIDHQDDFRDLRTPTNLKVINNLPIYSVEDERRDSRNWQKITLPDGRTREIDMRVIEPYKRVLSHGGYLHAGGHNAIVIFCACHLPDRSRADYHYVMDNLFLYVVKTLEQLVTEDYVLIYLHGGSNRRNFPPFPWLKKCYQLLDRRLRKSLKNLYLVHPTFWIKSFVWMTRPFVSAKFWRKLVYVRSLEELGTLVSVEKAAIPDKVRQYDAKCI